MICNWTERAQAQAAVEACQMNAPTEDHIMLLHGCLVRRLIQWEGMRDTLRVNKVHLKRREVTVKAYYFDSRPGIRFYSDGVVIAGWADDNNVKPFLGAIADWCEEVTGYVG